MASILGEDYLEQEQQGALQRSPGAAYGTQRNPAQAPSVEGGWGGILLSGLTAGIGLAADNPYMVAAGSAAGESYGKSYDNLNKSLIEEQRANRMAEASMERQKHLASWQRDLTAPDRALAQENKEREFGFKEKEFGLREAADKRATALHTAQMSEAQHNQKMRTDPAYAKQHALQTAKTQAEVATIMADAQAAQTAGQQAKQIANLEAMGVGANTIRMVKLQHAGLDVSKFMGKGAKYTPEAYQKTQTEVMNQFMTGEDYKKIKAESGEAAANQAALEMGTVAAQTVKQSYEEQQGFAFDWVGGGGGGGGNPQAVKGMTTALITGEETEESLMAQAETDAEKADAAKAIQAARETKPSGYEQSADEMGMDIPTEQPASEGAMIGAPVNPAAAAAQSGSAMMEEVTPTIKTPEGLTPSQHNKRAKMIAQMRRRNMSEEAIKKAIEAEFGQ